jgi:WD40 repeat protein
LKVAEVPETLALSADGKLLASSSWTDQGAAQAVRVWDLKSGKMLHQMQGPSAGPLAFSPNGRLLAQGSRSPVERDREKVVLWDTTSGKEVRRIGPGLYAVNALAFSPDGKLLATGGYRSDRGPAFGVRLWDVATGKKIREFHGNEDGERPNVLALAFSADGRMLASAGTGHVVHVWEVATGRERAALRGHEGAVYSLAFSRDGRLLASGSEDTTALVWDLNGQPRKGQSRGNRPD